jgi:hypothetical protein
VRDSCCPFHNIRGDETGNKNKNTPCRGKGSAVMPLLAARALSALPLRWAVLC